MAIRSNNCRRSHRAVRLPTMAIALALTAVSLPVNAQESFEAMDEAGPPVPDQELAQIRGKFIKSDSVSFFGISMVTSWQDANGVTTVARLLFNVDFLASTKSGDPVPQLLVGWVRDGDPSMDVTKSHSGYTPYLLTGDVTGIGGLEDTSGAAQANFIAGADNSALNGMQIALVPSSSIVGMDGAGLTSITETLGQSFADGDRLEFRLGANELAMFLTGDHGSDSATQSVGGEFGRLLQQNVLNSDGNSVVNNTAVIIGTDFNAQAFDAIRATEALSSMKGHGF